MIQFDATRNAAVLTVLFIISTLAILINGLLLYIFPRVRDKKNVIGLQLMTGVALGDIISALFCLVMCLAEIISNHEGLFSTWWYCSFLSMALYYFNGLSAVLICIVAIERFLLICFQKKLSSKIIWPVFGVVSLGYAITCFGHGIDGTYMFDYTFIFCIPRKSTISYVAIIVKKCIFIIPLFVLSICYVSIFIYCYRRQRLNNDFISRRATLRALCFLILYFVCFLPESLTIFWIKGPIPLEIGVMIPICLLFVMVLNPILVLFLHHEVKAKILSLIVFRPAVRVSDY